MKLLYATNVEIPAKDAQSLQILAMSKAFATVLGKNFLLVSPRTKEVPPGEQSFAWKRMRVLSHRRIFRYLSIIIAALLQVVRYRPNVVYSRDIGVVFTLTLLRIPSVYEIHKPFETRIGNRLFTFLSKRIHIVAISHALKKFVVDTYGVQDNKVLVAHDGVDISTFYIEKSKQMCRKEYLSVDEQKKVVLYSGSIQPGKGIDVVKKVALRIPDITFCILGTDNIEDAPTNMRCIPRQPQENVPYYLAAADLLILPNTTQLRYYAYTSPLKLFEYMSSNVPILSSDVGAITEILNSENAFLFDPEDIEQTAQVIHYAIEHPAEARKKATQAKKDVNAYTWSKRVEHILHFLDI